MKGYANSVSLLTYVQWVRKDDKDKEIKYLKNSFLL